MLELKSGTTAPKTVESFVNHGIHKYIINYDITENNGLYEWKSALIFPFTRDAIIDTIIRNEYSSSLMDAIRNDYELVRDGTAGDKTEDYTSEYLTMQAYRVHAKTVADLILEEYNSNKDK